MSLWILFMSQHLNPPSALSDHCESVAWFISNGPHSAAYCYKLGLNGVKAECLSPEGCHHLPTHSCNSRLHLAVATNHQVYGGFLPSSLARFHCVDIACSAHAVHQFGLVPAARPRRSSQTPAATAQPLANAGEPQAVARQSSSVMCRSPSFKC